MGPNIKVDFENMSEYVFGKRFEPEIKNSRSFADIKIAEIQISLGEIRSPQNHPKMKPE